MPTFKVTKAFYPLHTLIAFYISFSLILLYYAFYSHSGYIKCDMFFYFILKAWIHLILDSLIEMSRKLGIHGSCDSGFLPRLGER